jgi:hypothetical protein
VIDAGFADEVDWQSEIRFAHLTESSFLAEYAWVVFSSGFRESILRRKFPELRRAFLGFTSATTIAQRRAQCRRDALSIFGHQGKVTAILDLCKRVQADGFDHLRAQLELRGVEFIDELPFMGPATSYHLAKNIGLDVVKPDRHLVRIAKALGYASPYDLCVSIRDLVGDALSVIDIVIWRYATLHPHGSLPGIRQ